MFAVSNGAVQFMLYEEMKSAYNRYRQVPIDTKMVSNYELKIVFDLLSSSLKCSNC